MTASIVSLLENFAAEKMTVSEANIATCGRGLLVALHGVAVANGHADGVTRRELAKAIKALGWETPDIAAYSEKNGLPRCQEPIWISGRVFTGRTGIVGPWTIDTERTPFADYIQRDCVKGDRLSIPAHAGRDWFNSFLGFRGWKWQTAKTIDAMAAAEGYTRLRVGAALPVYRGFDLDCAHHEALKVAGFDLD
jgi:hypothetical protein